MDCFYAAVEERENPDLRGKPVAVGGSSRRGVICAANYEARKYGVRSAMPGFKAVQACPQLIMLPVRFDLYRAESAKIRAIFGRFTELIEPLSLDEAYLDVSHWQSTPSAIAREIRAQIFEETRLTASAGIAPNKMLAKIASDWNKPNGQFEVKQEQIADFMCELPVSKLWGVGKRMQEKLTRLGVKTCGDLQRFDKFEMSRRFGKWGLELHELSRGHDEREVKAHRSRKSISKENTFTEDVTHPADLLPMLQQMQEEIQELLLGKYRDRKVRSLVVKLKFSDFTRTTAESAQGQLNAEVFRLLLDEAWSRGHGKSVRLFGIGVRLVDEKDDPQLEMFPD
ncbi:DNA polymerase IV [Verrucomicrobiaceae bacterium R5-34]|uniref:DNA polymerase IV n=2 Tax=Oceaniferula flava TaxID=2800421 RepID=A0AAE2VCD7_9BACT|nr:DNA polymerase IV [Verrucomicrobiaceae bacterium R5-34]MBK1854876.1 DNA polymerase IV [Oceaniferula flavus]MBM1136182.1 DNA polymerase IV [Oceaniferula flavus]